MSKEVILIGWIRASKEKFAPWRVFMSSDYFMRGTKQTAMCFYPRYDSMQKSDNFFILERKFIP